MSGARTLALAAVVAGALAGCGTSRVVTNVPDARIYVDGERVGQDGEFRRRGAPGSATVLVMADDGRRKRVTIRRDFTLTTGLLGAITYGIGFFAFWEYPEIVVVNFDEPGGQSGSGWGDEAGGGDAWNRPPPGWQEPAPATPPPVAQPPGDPAVTPPSAAMPPGDSATPPPAAPTTPPPAPAPSSP